MAGYLSILCYENVDAQSQKSDSSSYDYKKIYSYCLDADVRSALALVEEKNSNLNFVDQKFKQNFYQRFKYTEDRSNLPELRKSPIYDLLKVFHTYWRRSLLNSVKENDSLFTGELYHFLKSNYAAAHNLVYNYDSLDIYLKKYIEQKSLHSTGLGKTGRLFDLLVWAKEKDTTYTFNLYDEVTTARVVLMEDFITLGWEEYATLDKYYPGGWATKEALYCVAKAYDLNSEKFRISYLAHESRHFADYKLLPDLTSADLEYRAKLMELSMAQTTLYQLIDFFIANGKKDSENGHVVANYLVIQSLSMEVFKSPFEKDMSKWKKVDSDSINKAAYIILKADTEERKRVVSKSTIGN